MYIPNDVIELLKVIAWPLTLLIILFLFRRPLARFLSGLSGRVTGISVLQFVSLEFAQGPPMGPAWEIEQTDVRRLAPAGLFDMPSKPFFEQLGRFAGEYAVIDLGQGDQWISSRLFIFAALLKRITRVRQFVFLGTQFGIAERFLGMASPDEVRWALAQHYPWLEGAYEYACTLGWPQGGSEEIFRNWNATKDDTWVTLTEHDELEPDIAREIAYRFVMAIQEQTRPPTFSETEWVEATINGTHFWERANKLDEAWLRQNLRQALDGGRSMVDSSKLDRVKRIQSIVRRPGQYIALLDGDRKFKSLVDRYELLDQSAPEIAELIGA